MQIKDNQWFILRKFLRARIHCFEPNSEELNKIKLQFNNDNIVLNNCAVGEKSDKKEFNITAISGHSSFKNINFKSTWVKERSKSININSNDYIKDRIKVPQISLDDYTKKNNIDFIDILKIDTQGYEDKVLEGCHELLKIKKKFT